MPNKTTVNDDLMRHLANHRIWSLLDAKRLRSLHARFQRVDYPAASAVLPQGQLHTRLGMVLSGTVSLSDPDLGFAIEMRPADLFGLGATPTAQLDTWQAQASTDCCVAWLEPDDLVALCKDVGSLVYFFPSLPAQNAAAVPPSGSSLNLLVTPVRSLIKRAPITLAPETTIQATAEKMRDLRVSSILIVAQGQLLGLVTDRDLRNRVVAQNIDMQRPVSDITTFEPLTVKANSPAFEALLLMAKHNIHHIPVMEEKNILGMITTTDLNEQQSTSAIYLVGDIFKQSNLEGLQTISPRVRQLQQYLAAADASAYSTGHIITAITDAITTRLIELAQAELGPPPVDYVWVAAGSQARNEQTAKSDQDNCLLLDDAYDEKIHGEYFKAFATRVCDGLAACGYIHCPGEMMAMTDMWRQPMRVWVEYFHGWVDKPKPKALMLTCVFFDLRAIHGKSELLDNLRQQVVQKTKGNSLFLSHMVANALKHRPPLGIFGQITLSKNGGRSGTIDLKHVGIVPIVDLARIYALAAGVTVANTHDRLEVSAQANEISAKSAHDLRDALEFLGKLRIAHQARQTAKGQVADNYLSLDELSNFERNHLKEAFGVVQTLQGVLQSRY